MIKWLFTAVLLAPCAAQAAPTPSPPPQRPTPIDYAVPRPASHAYVGQGWGLYASMHGRSMDLSSYNWTEDPHAQSRDIEAGYGWRSGNKSALIGYDQHDYGPKTQQRIAPGQRDPNLPPQVSSSGVLGFSFVLHGR
ncbi:MAG TPA: hypothetical protein VFE13_14215 [Caulobacteraceae bacterium]|jgi:hypothetical protein|nr:hypothetical protein [Caulobacteraceae bacterium]